MKNVTLSILAAGTFLWSLSSCSSTQTETATTDATTETVTTNEPDAQTRANEGAVTTEGAADDDAAARTAAADTTSFAMVAASSDMFEILSSQDANTRGMHADVKKFAQQMITDHTKTSTELKGIAAGKNITLPAGPLPMHQRMLQKVTQADAKKFDEAYMSAQVTAHQQAVALFETASKNERDPELKAFAAKHLPHLRMHLDMAKKTKDKVD